MKILVVPHHLESGGQTVAIELAAAVRHGFGHDVVLFATPGPAAALARRRGLRLLHAPPLRLQPSTVRMGALRDAVAGQSPDLVHAWDRPQVLEAYLGLRLTGDVPVLGTSMSTTWERFLPRAVPMTFGTAQLHGRARRLWRSPVDLFEPPVDTDANHPGAVDAVDVAEFRHRHRLPAGVPTVVIVARLSGAVEVERVRCALAAVARLASDRPIRLVVVGGGDALAELAVDAAIVGGRTVVLTGPMADPRPAYAAATVVLGTGASAQRAMAFAKPVIVLGEQGFSEVFTPETAGQLLWQGCFGYGNGEHGPDRLARQLGALLDDREQRAKLGAFGLQTINERFALEPAAARLDAIYRRAVSADRASRSALVVEGARSLVVRAGAEVVAPRLKPRSPWLMAGPSRCGRGDHRGTRQPR